MRFLSKAAIGGSLVTAATVGALAAGGVFATSVVVAPPAGARALTAFDDCSQLLAWYVDHGVRDVGPWGWGDMRVYAAEGDLVAPRADAAGVAGRAGSETTGQARTASGTGTNTQEADVDEPDLAKTDGTRVVSLDRDRRTLVVTDVSGSAPRELGRLALPQDVYGGELLLVGDHVLVSMAGWGRPMPVDDVAPGLAGAAIGRVAMPMAARLLDVDVADAAHPRLVRDEAFSGTLVSVRQYGDVVRVVTSTPRPELRWTYPGKGISEAEAKRRNQALVRATTIRDWLPTVGTGSRVADRTPLLSCKDVYHPAAWAGDGTIAVTTYDVGAPDERDSVGVTAGGQVVYSSADRLYVASTEWGGSSAWRRMSGGLIPQHRPDVTTELHAFALDGRRTTYVASGSVPGSIHDRWSLDEHDGRLRVAWTRNAESGGELGRQDNGITILAERGDRLVPTGQVAELGLDENVQAVRWFDDLAVLVTFRQMDPLYTIDLSDADHPRARGALKIPGYSGYLHPIGGDRLLGLGVDATSEGRRLGAQAALFDVADLAHPRRLDRQAFGSETNLAAVDDPRAFTWLPEASTALTTLSDWRRPDGRGDLLALTVGTDGRLAQRSLLHDVRYDARTLPLPGGRVAVVDDRVRVLSVT